MSSFLNYRKEAEKKDYINFEFLRNKGSRKAENFTRNFAIYDYFQKNTLLSSMFRKDERFSYHTNRKIL